MKQILSIIAIIVFACVANAQSPQLYYYAGSSQAYTRSQVYNPPYYYGGCVYPGYYSYTYTPYYAPATYNTYNTTTYTPPAATPFDYKAALASLAKQKIEGAEFLDGLAKLGFAPAPPQIYAGGYSVAGTSYYNAAPAYGITATTAYGYAPLTYNQQLAVQPAQRDNTDLLAQVASQLIQGGTDTTGKLSSVLQRQEETKAELSRNLIRLEMFKQSIYSMKDTAIQSGTTTTIRPALPVQNAPPPQQQPTQPQQPAQPLASDDADVTLLNQWASLAEAKCAVCHFKAKDGTGVVKGGFDLNNYLGMSDADRAGVLAIIDPSRDSATRMPKVLDASGKYLPGTALTAQEVGLFKSVRAPRKK